MSDDLGIARTLANAHSEDGLSSNTDAYRTSPAVAPSHQKITALSNPDLSPPAASSSGRTPPALKQSASTPGIDDSPSELITAHLAEFFPSTQTAPKGLDSEYTHRPRRDVRTSSSGRTPPESASTPAIDVDGPPSELITTHLAESFPYTQTAPNLLEHTHHPLKDVDEEEDQEETVEWSETSAAPDQNGIEWTRGALIGSGSFGSIYLGMNKVTGMLMAVKQFELPPGSSHNEEHEKRILTELQREIDLLKDLQHDNIAQYLDSSIDGQYFNIFLAYVPGGSVATLLKNYGAFEEPLIHNFVRQVLQGLDYLHERGIIHRNIKGGNILVDNKGGIKISDFGISKEVADDILKICNGPSLQSAFWMAPEVVEQGLYTSKADIWSLGCLIVEMFTAQHPYPELSQMQAIFQIGQSVKPAMPNDISSGAEDFLNQTFEVDYQARPLAAELATHPWIICQ
ncbi:Pkinase-domain-containing protein [Exidia glandulosa HHB12029]|uniref:Pkinase-domain-containing protein n=1 Tax=Exidia glandulosa HHB12029 TaxID=1314781 RepID=A0A165J477_EXIGL|nr:Pkinase-domain-containing protein [Exidia glandulosa HHB12029]